MSGDSGHAMGPPDQPASGSLDAGRRDAICDAFEREWIDGRRPRIEDFLADAATAPEREALFRDLLAVEIEYRVRHEETVLPEEYTLRFPDLSAQVAAILDRMRSEETILDPRGTRQRLGHFELIEKIGSGAFGTVWRARDTKLQRLVAVKIPHRHLLDEGGSRQIVREARAAARLRHPNIVGVYEAEQDGGVPYIACELIEGVNLSEWLKIRSPAPRDSAALCAKLAHALQHAHEAGIVHRDLKPGNVLVDRRDEPHIADFGLAKFESAEMTATAEGQLIGTPAYMSPEQAEGRSHAVNARSDIYSLGVVLYRLLTGELPFSGSKSLLVYQVINDEPRAPRRLRRDVPRDLETICLKAMAKDPAKRYATAQEMAEDLERFQRGEPIKARRTSLLERGWRWVRRNRSVSASSGVTLLAVALLLGLLLGGRGETTLTFPVTLETVPPGATVVFVPLDAVTGLPQGHRLVRIDGPRPVRTRLEPGDYLVVAHLEGHGFHEVYRRVPEALDRLPGMYRHDGWKVRDGTVELPAIEIPPYSVVEGMARLEGAAEFEMGAEDVPLAPPHYRRVRAFWLDTTEVRSGQFIAGVNSRIPDALRESPPPDVFPVTHVTWDDAVAAAERMGKRLPDEAEYEFAATGRGTRRFPWGDEPPVAGEPPTFGPVGEPVFDRGDTDPPIFGLFSNVAEWTASRVFSYPGMEQMPRPPNDDQFRIVRGVWSIRMLKGEAEGPNGTRGPRERYPRPALESLPGLGFRCARSAHPRLTPEDFTTNRSP